MTSFQIILLFQPLVVFITDCSLQPYSVATDDDINVTSSASISCSRTTHSRRSACDDDNDVDDDDVDGGRDVLYHQNSFARISVHRISAATRKNPTAHHDDLTAIDVINVLKNFLLSVQCYA